MRKTIQYLVLGLLFGASATTPIHAQIYTPDFVRFKLKNGLAVLFHKDTSTASVSINMAYHAGSSLDPRGKKGLANLCGGLVVLGSENVSYREMLRLRYYATARIKGRTTTDLMSISSTFPAPFLEAALWLEADRMQNSHKIITDDIVQSVTSNLVASQSKSTKEPLANVDSKIYEQLYPESHPYRHTSIGDTADLKTIRSADVQQFMSKYYVPSNATLTIAGNFDFDAASSAIEKHFGSIPAGESFQWNDLPPLPSLGIASIIKEDLVSYSRLYIIFPTVPRNHPDAPALDFFAKYLAGTTNAKLQQSLVNRNPYILDIEASQSSRELDGNFWIIINCKYESVLKDVYEALKRELMALGNGLLTPGDLEEARNYSKMMYNIVMEELFGLGGRAETMNCDALLEGTPLFHSNAIAEQQRITPQKLQHVVQQYFSFENILTLSIVPKGAKDKGIIFE